MMIIIMMITIIMMMIMIMMTIMMIMFCPSVYLKKTPQCRIKITRTAFDLSTTELCKTARRESSFK